MLRVKQTLASEVPWWAGWLPVRSRAEAVFDEQGKLYLVRYTVFRSCRVRLYVHILVQGDAGRHPHLHPWIFITVPLVRGYDELRRYCRIRVRPFLPRLRTRSVFHRVAGIEPGRPAITLVLAFVGNRSETGWGFDVDGELVPSSVYGSLGTKVFFPANGVPVRP